MVAAEVCWNLFLGVLIIVTFIFVILNYTNTKGGLQAAPIIRISPDVTINMPEDPVALYLNNNAAAE